MPRIKALHLPASLLASPSTPPVMPEVCLHGNCNRLLCGCLGIKPERERAREREGREHPTQGVEVLIRERLCLLLTREAVSHRNKALARIIIKGPYGHLVYPLPEACQAHRSPGCFLPHLRVCLIIRVCVYVGLSTWLDTSMAFEDTRTHTLHTCLLVFPCCPDMDSVPHVCLNFLNALPV